MWLIGYGLVAGLANELHEYGVVDVDFAVFESPAQHLFAHLGLLVLDFVEGLFYFYPGFGGAGDVEPLLFGFLGGRGEYFDGVSAFQLIPDGLVLAVDLAACAATAQLAVYEEGEVEQRGAFGQFVEVAFGGEDKDLFVVEVHAEFFHQLHGASVARFEYVAHVVEPVVETFLAFQPLVFPVGGEPPFGDFVHAFGAYLHLDPAVSGSPYGDV